MNETNPIVTEADLHAYADGQLAETARARVEAFLADNPDEAAMVAEWQGQNTGIKTLFSGYEKAKDTDALLVAPPRAASSAPNRWMAAAAALLVFALGAVSGHYGPTLLQKPDLRLTGSETLPNRPRPPSPSMPPRFATPSRSSPTRRLISPPGSESGWQSRI